MSTPAAAAGRSVIAIAVDSSANNRLLNEILGDHYSLRQGLDGVAGYTLDLLIVDASAVRRHRTLIRQLRSDYAPLVLPVLLMVENRQVVGDGFGAELGGTVDDILRIPTTRVELSARIENLLRLHRLSQEQESARRQLADVVDALNILNACDQVLVRASEESQLLEQLCCTIVDTDSYQLAWEGLAEGDSDGRLTILARAGEAAAFVDQVAANWKADPRYAGSRSRLFETGESVVTTNLNTETRNRTDLYALAVDHGLASVIILPLPVEIGETAYLAICSGTTGHFDEDERRLLERLAANLTHALNTLRFQRERERQTAEIRDLAFSDALTGLYNRHYLLDYLDDRLYREDMTEMAAAAILFIDLDGFKLINDVLGHEAGDAVLVQVANRLRRAVRDSDLIIRHGGDEFLVVIFDDPRTGPPVAAADPAAFLEVAETLAERIIEHLGEPVAIGDQAHRLSASIGISICPEHGQDASTIIQAADTAMYEAKKQGGGTTRIFSKTIFARRQLRLSLENRLRNAIDDGQLVLHYQPIFALDDRRVVGAEALVRWPQDNGEMMMPGEFIPLAEETRLINPLGDWVLATAARQLQRWRAQGSPIRVMVNLSVHQLQIPGGAEHIGALVRPYIDPAWMTLEITESVLMTDPTAMEILLHSLNRDGFQIAIDDFGTGYSSLSRLQHLPIQALKIDRSFTAQLAHDGRGIAMVQIIQQMAASLGLETVAEGIESEQQYRQLRKAGVNLGQGYWYGRPVAPEAFDQWLYEKSTSP